MKNYIKVFILGITGIISIPSTYADEVKTTTHLNLRVGPGTNHAVVTSIPINTAIKLQHCIKHTNWCKVSYNSHTGFVSYNYLNHINWVNKNSRDTINYKKNTNELSNIFKDNGLTINKFDETKSSSIYRDVAPKPLIQFHPTNSYIDRTPIANGNPQNAPIWAAPPLKKPGSNNPFYPPRNSLKNEEQWGGGFTISID